MSPPLESRESGIGIGQRVRITNGDYSGRTATIEDRHSDPLSGVVIDVWVDPTTIGQDFHDGFLHTLYPSEVEKL